MAVRRREKKDTNELHGEDLLGQLNLVRVDLGPDKVYRFAVGAELAIPTERHAIVAAARRAPRRYAFWADATEAALQRVRIAERTLTEAKAGAAYHARVSFEDPKSKWDRYTEGMVNDAVSLGDTVRNAERELETARLRYGRIRMVRDAVWMRSEMLKRIVGGAA